MTEPDVAFRDAEYIADVSGISYGPDTSLSAQQPAASGGQQHNRRVRKVQTTAKVAFIDRLLRDLDVLIYCELSALYYMDCSVILFAVRAVVELIFFTPKASPFDPTRNQPYIGAIIASNLFCMIFHAFFIRPEAGEDTRGYLHGGLFIDFIGQAPVPIFRLLLLDALIFLLDFVMLGLIVERVKMVGPTETNSNTTTTSSTTTNATTTTNENTNTNTDGNTQSQQQDHDAEERGILRETGNTEEEAGATTAMANVDEDDIDEERTTLLADPGEDESPASGRNTHPLDQFASGQAVILDMGFWDIVRDQWQYSTTPRRPTGYVPSPETATFLRQRFGLQVGTDGRIVRVDRE
ncbi:hypothetical protein N7474_005786 [Penicillium riverlandense]|uniref:uncharacterized protein n=1 Tax=Penicillium riverlandense TaxID=1903569 RepID=UPI0025468ED7|nr:uncharacterized protein N7474_005786 [Penicillium riverlandense]KAJ5820195.1 hypothetical protein N7474_005786 [Penicillium riverlandense]